MQEKQGRVAQSSSATYNTIDLQEQGPALCQFFAHHMMKIQAMHNALAESAAYQDGLYLTNSQGVTDESGPDAIFNKANELALAVFNLIDLVSPTQHIQLYGQLTTSLAVIAKVYNACGDKLHTIRHGHKAVPKKLTAATLTELMIERMPHSKSSLLTEEQQAIILTQLWSYYASPSLKRKKLKSAAIHRVCLHFIEQCQYTQLGLNFASIMLGHDGAKKKTVELLKRLLQRAKNKLETIESAGEVVAFLLAMSTLYKHVVSAEPYKSDWHDYQLLLIEYPIKPLIEFLNNLSADQIDALDAQPLHRLTNLHKVWARCRISMQVLTEHLLLITTRWHVVLSSNLPKEINLEAGIVLCQEGIQLSRAIKRLLTHELAYQPSTDKGRGAVSNVTKKQQDELRRKVVGKNNQATAAGEKLSLVAAKLRGQTLAGLLTTFQRRQQECWASLRAGQIDRVENTVMQMRALLDTFDESLENNYQHLPRREIILLTKQHQTATAQLDSLQDMSSLRRLELAFDKTTDASKVNVIRQKVIATVKRAKPYYLAHWLLARCDRFTGKSRLASEQYHHALRLLSSQDLTCADDYGLITDDERVLFVDSWFRHCTLNEIEHAFSAARSALPQLERLQACYLKRLITLKHNLAEPDILNLLDYVERYRVDAAIIDGGELLRMVGAATDAAYTLSPVDTIILRYFSGIIKTIPHKQKQIALTALLCHGHAVANMRLLAELCYLPDSFPASENLLQDNALSDDAVAIFSQLDNLVASGQSITFADVTAAMLYPSFHDNFNLSLAQCEHEVPDISGALEKAVNNVLRSRLLRQVDDCTSVTDALKARLMISLFPEGHQPCAMCNCDPDLVVVQTPDSDWQQSLASIESHQRRAHLQSQQQHIEALGQTVESFADCVNVLERARITDSQRLSDADATQYKLQLADAKMKLDAIKHLQTLCQLRWQLDNLLSPKELPLIHEQLKTLIATSPSHYLLPWLMARIHMIQGDRADGHNQYFNAFRLISLHDESASHLARFGKVTFTEKKCLFRDWLSHCHMKELEPVFLAVCRKFHSPDWVSQLYLDVLLDLKYQENVADSALAVQQQIKPPVVNMPSQRSAAVVTIQGYIPESTQIFFYGGVIRDNGHGNDTDLIIVVSDECNLVSAIDLGRFYSDADDVEPRMEHVVNPYRQFSGTFTVGGHEFDYTLMTESQYSQHNHCNADITINALHQKFGATAPVDSTGLGFYDLSQQCVRTINYNTIEQQDANGNDNAVMLLRIIRAATRPGYHLNSLDALIMPLYAHRIGNLPETRKTVELTKLFCQGRATANLQLLEKLGYLPYCFHGHPSLLKDDELDPAILDAFATVDYRYRLGEKIGLCDVFAVIYYQPLVEHFQLSLKTCAGNKDKISVALKLALDKIHQLPAVAEMKMSILLMTKLKFSLLRDLYLNDYQRRMVYWCHDAGCGDVFSQAVDNVGQVRLVVVERQTTEAAKNIYTYEGVSENDVNAFLHQCKKYCQLGNYRAMLDFYQALFSVFIPSPDEDSLQREPHQILGIHSGIYANFQRSVAQRAVLCATANAPSVLPSERKATAHRASNSIARLLTVGSSTTGQHSSQDIVTQEKMMEQGSAYVQTQQKK